MANHNKQIKLEPNFSFCEETKSHWDKFYVLEEKAKKLAIRSMVFWPIVATMIVGFILTGIVTGFILLFGFSSESWVVGLFCLSIFASIVLFLGGVLFLSAPAQKAEKEQKDWLEHENDSPTSKQFLEEYAIMRETAFNERHELLKAAREAKNSPNHQAKYLYDINRIKQLSKTCKQLSVKLNGARGRKNQQTQIENQNHNEKGLDQVGMAKKLSSLSNDFKRDLPQWKKTYKGVAIKKVSNLKHIQFKQSIVSRTEGRNLFVETNIYLSDKIKESGAVLDGVLKLSVYNKGKRIATGYYCAPGLGCYNFKDAGFKDGMQISFTCLCRSHKNIDEENVQFLIEPVDLWLAKPNNTIYSIDTKSVEEWVNKCDLAFDQLISEADSNTCNLIKKIGGLSETSQKNRKFQIKEISPKMILLHVLLIINLTSLMIAFFSNDNDTLLGVGAILFGLTNLILGFWLGPFRKATKTLDRASEYTANETKPRIDETNEDYALRNFNYVLVYQGLKFLAWMVCVFIGFIFGIIAIIKLRKEKNNLK